MKPHRVVTPRKDEKTGKTYWTRIGSAFLRSGGGMSIFLDALPMGRELIVFPPDERDSNSQPDGDDVPY